MILDEKRGRPRRYKTAKQLRRAVHGYFAAISYYVDATREVETGERDQYGHPVTERVKAYNQNGEVPKVLQWIEPPSVLGLCLHLGIHRSTWARWEQDEELQEVCADAKMVIEHYLEGRLSERHVQGTIFNLTHNFGWTDRTEVVVAGNVEDYLARLSAENREQTM